MDTIVARESETDTKPLKEVAVIQDHGIFTHDTGDTYDGYFEAKKKDRSVKMNGPGVYTTAEGDIYSATWESDRLGANNDISISFAEGAKYEGSSKDWAYSGRGRYTYPDRSKLIADFQENTPMGSLTLIDPNGHIWLGRAEQGFGWFDPVNHFYDSLEKNREGKMRKHRKSLLGVRSTVSN